LVFILYLAEETVGLYQTAGVLTDWGESTGDQNLNSTQITVAGQRQIQTALSLLPLSAEPRQNRSLKKLAANPSGSFPGAICFTLLGK
jgi:hypothetical protein